MHSFLRRFVMLCLLALELSRCTQDTVSVLVHVKNLTPNINSLQANVILDGKSAMQRMEFTQQLSHFTIQLQASAIGGGKLVIDVIGLANDHCEISTGRIDSLVSQNISYTELDVDLVQLPTELCTLLNQISPALGPSSGGVALQLKGQNFVQGATVTIDNVLATDLTIIAPDRLTVLLPAMPGAFGQVPVVISTPDGQRATRNDLFAYYSSQLAFSMMTSAVGANPHLIAVSDFNGDQASDLAVANYDDGTVGVLLGDGLGGFTTQRIFAVGSLPISIAVADFNQDQKLDLAVTNLGSDNVSLLLGDGKGGFAPQRTFSIGAGALSQSIDVGNFNQDQWPDLAVSSGGTGKVIVLLNDGTGGFTQQKQISVGTRPSALVVSDFNGDQKMDIAVGDGSSTNGSVLLGDGTGNFATPRLFAAGSQLTSIATGDFNGDQKSDLAVAFDYSSNISVLLGDGMGNFVTQKTFTVGYRPSSIRAGDLNGDQKSDLVVANYGSNTVGVLLGDGNGNFATQQTFELGGCPLSAVIGRFDRNQKIDIVASDSCQNKIVVLTNQSL